MPTKKRRSSPAARRPKRPRPEPAQGSPPPALLEEDREPGLAPEVLLDGPVEEELKKASPAVPRKASLVRSGAGELARGDPLQLYMAEVGRHPLLSREEEYQLAVQYRETGDLKAAYRLVASNLRLVVKLANDYHRNPLSLLDLIQEGNIGLMQAVKKYDPSRGVKLSSYAAWWIRAYILRYIMDNWKMVKIGTTEAQRKLFFKLRQEQQRLLSEGFEATPKLLAERLNVSEREVVEMDQRLGQDEVSLDAPLGDDSKSTRADRMLSSTAMPADERLGNEELKRLFREKLTEFAKALRGKELFIYENRLIADQPLTLQEIGDHYGFSRERVRQIEAALIDRIRQQLREQIPDFDLVAVPKN